MGRSLAQITAEVADEWAAMGVPLTVPPDPFGDRSDACFWATVERRWKEQSALETAGSE